MIKLTIIAVLIAVFAVGILMGSTMVGTNTETVIVPKTETVTNTVTETVETEDTAACDLLFDWYYNTTAKAFSTETDVMYDEYIGVCGV